jgi:outer membrane lipoprotein SlyB
MKTFVGKLVVFAMLAFTVALSGCVTQPTYQQAPPYGYRGGCPSCGVVQNVQQIYVQKQGNGTLGTIIGAVAGGVLGSTIGKGDGRTAATVVGAVAGGAVGNQVGQQGAGTVPAFQVTIRLDNGQFATVTQANDPGVRPGDYVQINNNQVYAR